MADEIPVDKQNQEKADILVPIGSQASATKERVQFDDNYEAMAEDFIDTFNNGVTQGMFPLQALYAQASAFSITLGCFIRAGLSQAEVGKLLMMVGRNAAVSSKMVQIIQNQTAGEATADIIRKSEPREH